MNKDRYSEIGPRVLVDNFDIALEKVRLLYPKVGVEGSTGAERTFVVQTPRGAELVAHCWPKHYLEDRMYLRIKPVGIPGPIS